MLSNASQLKKYISASNIIFTALPLVSYYLLPTYSSENALLLSQQNPLSYSISFDAAHFLTNQYKYEKNYAFLPGFVLIIRFLNSIFPLWTTVLIILTINKICTLLSSIILMNIVNLVSDSKNLGLLAGILFLFNPVSIFFHAVYSEAIYTFLTFAGIYLFVQKQLNNQIQFEQSLSKPLVFVKNHLISLVLLGISCSFRTTGVFISLIYGVPILTQLYKFLMKADILKSIKVIITGILTLSFFLVFLLIYFYHGYQQFCVDSLVKPLFCSWNIPNIYQYIQIEFWNCGFLQYYAFQRTFFIIIGLPSLIVSIITVSKSKLTGLNLSYYVLLFVTIVYSNIQSSARFFSTHPLYFYGLAQYLQINNEFSKSQRKVILYLISYNIFGILMFPHRFIWT